MAPSANVGRVLWPKKVKTHEINEMAMNKPSGGFELSCMIILLASSPHKIPETLLFVHGHWIWFRSKPEQQLTWSLSAQYASHVTAHARFGSKADMTLWNRDVRFTPESRHCSAPVGCSLCARSRHSTAYSITSPVVASIVGGKANPTALIACPLIASAQNGRNIHRGLRYSTRFAAQRIRNSIIPVTGRKSQRAYYTN
jgi:hypothetical protein